MTDSTSAAAGSRPSKGDRTRQRILRAAADLASIDGLAGLSIAKLADAVGMSKAGLFAHFGSKEDLQVATVEAARQVVRQALLPPVVAAPPGLRRLWALCESYIHYQASRTFPGGCFFHRNGPEYDVLPVRVRAAIAEAYRTLDGRFVDAAREAQRLEEITAEIDSEQLGFELVAWIREAERRFLFNRDLGELNRARTTIRVRLKGLATPAAPPLPAPKRARKQGSLVRGSRGRKSPGTASGRNGGRHKG
ncbi:MAG: TetR/AcrR family transcriptional regulator [Alphaproteobacteria bacterium]